MPAPLGADAARTLILSGEAHGPLHVQGRLDLSGTRLTRLPDHLSADVLDVSGTGLTQLPEHLQVGELIATDLPLHEVPGTLRVQFRLVLDRCASLTRLPRDLQVGSLSLQDCASLEALPEGLDVCFLNLNRCEAFHHWPQRGRLRFGHLSAQDCPRLHDLPGWITHVAQLDVQGCRSLTRLPGTLRVSGWVDVGGSALSALPDERVPLRWRGVRVDARTAFRPWELTVPEILETANVERRRVMLDRVGPERLLAEAGTQVLDRDEDAGGERLLVRVPLSGDEPFVAVCVGCPSTGRRYVLRVPPTLTSAHAASAWLAGFDDPAAYRPAVEA